MPTSINYSFLSYLKRGLSAKIDNPDHFGDDPSETAMRPALDFDVSLTGAADFQKTLNLMGPGEVESISQSAILRHAPVDGETEFLPNYLAFIDFYEEDFPWRHTPLSPATPSGSSDTNLRPWLFLVVLKNSGDEPEYRYENFPDAPNRVIRILQNHSVVFPDESQIWAWSHVQVTGEELESLSDPSLKDRMLDILEGEPYKSVSRIICPRKLQQDESYTAFLIPSFELGRRAGLGIALGDSDVQEPAWAVDNNSSTDLYPVYYSFDFQTGTSGDFEALARRIKASLPAADLGRIPINIKQPNHPELNGKADDDYVYMGGTLRPAGGDNSLFIDSGNEEFTNSLQTLVNLGSNLDQEIPEGMVDPVISLPLYGRWHAAEHTIDQNEYWLSELNLDPRFRVAAGIGGKVFRDNQEVYMQMAWKQVGEVNEANRKLALAEAAYVVAEAACENHLEGLPGQVVLNTTSSTHAVARDTENGMSVKMSITNSRLPNAIVDIAFANILRPQASIMRKSNLSSGQKHRVADSVADGSVNIVPPEVMPSERADVADALSDDLRTGANYLDGGAKEDFVLLKPSDSISHSWSSGEFDSPQAAYFRSQAANLYSDAQATIDMYPSEPVPLAVSVGGLANEVLAALEPSINFSAQISTWLYDQDESPDINVKWLQKPMASPSIDLPVFDVLKTYSKELIVPNFHLVGENTLTLLETNNKFIEAFMVGLNYEMGRELLWNEYPTDQRGTYFARFWDTEIVLPHISWLVVMPLIEEIWQNHYNLEPIHTWTPDSILGEHNSGFASADGNLVVVLRADLLKKFPNLFIYAAKAGEWEPVEGEDDVYKRDIDHDTAEKRFPIYYGKMQPDALLLGFNLSAEEAKGEAAPDGETGWYIVMEERVGDIRFGLDVYESGAPFKHSLDGWEDLNWAHMGSNTGQPTPISDINYINILELNADASFITASATPLAQNSANLAQIFYQPPVRVSIHANDLISG